MRHVLVATTALAALLVACSEHTAPSGGGTTVAVQDNFFGPQQLLVAPGAAVTWAWSGNNPHNVTFDDGPASSTRTQGNYTRTFTAAATYPYHCTVHGLAMSGTVQVSAP